VRDAAATEREEATARRQSDASRTQLAMAFAELAEQFYAADTFEEVLQEIVDAAVSSVAGCQMASITLSERGAYQTAATTTASARAVDQAQYDAQEGPCLDAVNAPIVYARSFPDGRWPALGSRPADLGARSAASYRLAAASLPVAETGGSLNTYGGEPDVFDDEAQQIGLVLAAHASMAAGAVRERSHLQNMAINLNAALLSRDVIGQAKGILMERLKLTPEDAFDALRDSSQRLNAKLRVVAERLTETGQLDAGDGSAT
jgi:GAF domain-containing protein